MSLRLALGDVDDEAEVRAREGRAHEPPQCAGRALMPSLARLTKLRRLDLEIEDATPSGLTGALQNIAALPESESPAI